MTAAKINLQLPGLQKGVEAREKEKRERRERKERERERNSDRLQNSVRCIMTITFSMCGSDLCRQKEVTKFIFWHLTELHTTPVMHEYG